MLGADGVYLVVGRHPLVGGTPWSYQLARVRHAEAMQPRA